MATNNKLKRSTNNKRPRDNFSKKLSGVKQLVNIFKPERYIYAGVTLISFFILIFSLVYELVKGGGDVFTFTLQFGSTGVITFTTARALKMWNDALEFLNSSDEVGEHS